MPKSRPSYLIFISRASIYLPGCKTSHPLKLPNSSGSSSIKFLPPLLVLPPVPVRGGNGGLLSPSSSKLAGPLLPTGFLSAIDRLAGGGLGSSLYCACDGVVCELFFDSSEGFLVGIGGGAGLRRTCGPVRWDGGGGGWYEELVTGRVGRERVDAAEGVRRRSLSASRLPSNWAVCVACVGNAGTMSFLALGFGGVFCCRLVGVEVPLKSTVRALCEPRAGGGSGRPPMRCTSTQSGSGLGVKGLLGRFWLGMWPSEGGWTRALAGRPLEDEYPC